MIGGIRRTVVVMCLVAAAVGCDTAEPVFRGPKPLARILAARVEEARADFATLQFDVEVENTSAQDLSLVGMRYGLGSGLNTFLSGAPVSGVALGAQETTVFSLTDEVAYERLLRGLDARAGSEVPFRLELRLLLETADSARLRVSVNSDGRLLLPAVSQAGGGEALQPLDVVYIATPQDVVERMLTLAAVSEDDLVYDLGCGDGRIAITAAREHACKAVGYDIDPHWIGQSRENVRRHGLEQRVTIQQRDIFTVDMAPADVVAFYLNPVVNRRLVPQFRRLKKGARIVSHSFPVGDARPKEVVRLTSREDGREHVIYLYAAPLETP